MKSIVIEKPNTLTIETRALIEHIYRNTKSDPRARFRSLRRAKFALK
ncbi:hypothetical protein LTSEBAI_2695 [Salmonella enterica subsp. enterica serovar Baildon str. R6-199]|nr:hypothetical protein LTSEBAI_2695 [Salmonella enterica subsp. enterica serovar Baildon str. R6-199]